MWRAVVQVIKPAVSRFLQIILQCSQTLDNQTDHLSRMVETNNNKIFPPTMNKIHFNFLSDNCQQPQSSKSSLNGCHYVYDGLIPQFEQQTSTATNKQESRVATLLLVKVSIR